MASDSAVARVRRDEDVWRDEGVWMGVFRAFNPSSLKEPASEQLSPWLELLQMNQ